MIERKNLHPVQLQEKVNCHCASNQHWQQYDAISIQPYAMCASSSYRTGSFGDASIKDDVIKEMIVRWLVFPFSTRSHRQRRSRNLLPLTNATPPNNCLKNLRMPWQSGSLCSMSLPITFLKLGKVCAFDYIFPTAKTLYRALKLSVDCGLLRRRQWK
ncbi:hypothetical protein M513_03103 [Trichuris suis]|uniref:Uncharacterized protein n=2 Tax=Trichuris suis TaxID=68888 RepID=A0A085MFI3_9BILA|nr:hypothetical protein M513_03103 [Trichuris suis]